MGAELHKIGLAADPVNADAIGLIEDVLERLIAGETVAVAVVEVRKARTVATAYTAGEHYHTLNSGCARLAARIATEVDE
jgi:hypothetical protein